MGQSSGSLSSAGVQQPIDKLRQERKRRHNEKKAVRRDRQRRMDELGGDGQSLGKLFEVTRLGLGEQMKELFACL